MKLYTQNVCPKCMLAKMWIQQSGKEVEFINLDEQEELREVLRSKGLSSLPVLEVDGEFITDQNEIQKVFLGWLFIQVEQAMLDILSVN